MPLQKIFLLLCFLGLLIATHQEIILDDNDTGVTVTHPSVFHEDHSDYRITIKGSADDHLYGPKNHPETLDYGERVRSIFELADESSSSSSDSSDITDASESSDNEAKRKAFQDISERMKNFEEQAMREIKKQKEFAQAHGKEPWQTLKPKRRDGPHSVNISADEREKFENAKREFEEAWKDFQTKFKNGEDVSEYLNTTD